MKKSGVFLLSIVFLLYSNVVFASSHYSYEHSQELFTLIEWREYGQEAFDEAITKNKPIYFVLSAPSWCYWCHVYESEDFLFHPTVYPYINENFIPVFVDADKRQDLTRQYLEGGWPSTTVMAPNKERLYGFSGPRPPENLLANMQQAVSFVSSRGFSNILQINYEKKDVKIPTLQELNAIQQSFPDFSRNSFDRNFGGFGFGLKFPQPRTLSLFLDTYTKTNSKEWLDLATQTLRNQITDIDKIESEYKIFDPIDGGFHRYSTRQDWTIPHYEKMLYDNARILKTYSQLYSITNDELTKEVVDKTISYMLNELYDEEFGGFYGNQDADEEYFLHAERRQEKPRIEKTKYTDWNSEAIITFFYISNIFNNDNYKNIAIKSMDFFADNMITEQGALHFYAPDSTKGVTGNLLDNSYLLLALVDAYEQTKDKKYLNTAEKIANFSINSLYDAFAGGFFERNSQDTDLYSTDELILTSKPAQENGIIIYALSRLYKTTGNLFYLNAAIKSFGATIGSMGQLDRGYYYAIAAEYILQNNLLDEYQNNKAIIDKHDKELQDNFFLNDLIEKKQVQFVATEEGLEKLEGPILILLIIALLAGLLSFLSPCTLPILPAYIAYSLKSSKQNIKGMTLAFFLGLSIVFTLLGMSATFVGSLLRNNVTIFSQVAGIIIMILGIVMLTGKGFAGLKIKHKNPTTYFSSFLFGGAFGMAWTPCVGPILVAILLMASTTSSVFTGGLLLFIYAVGLAIPLILISTYMGKINKESKLWKFIEGKEINIKFGSKIIRLHTTSLISGILFIILGYLIFSGTLFVFNQYVTTTSFQKYIFGLEDKLLGLLR